MFQMQQQKQRGICVAWDRQILAAAIWSLDKARWASPLLSSLEQEESVASQEHDWVSRGHPLLQLPLQAAAIPC